MHEYIDEVHGEVIVLARDILCHRRRHQKRFAISPRCFRIKSPHKFPVFNFEFSEIVPRESRILVRCYTVPSQLNKPGCWSDNNPNQIIKEFSSILCSFELIPASQIMLYSTAATTRIVIGIASCSLDRARIS